MARPLAGYLTHRRRLRRLRRQRGRHPLVPAQRYGRFPNFRFTVADLFNAPLQPGGRARSRRRVPLPLRRRRASTSRSPPRVLTHLLEADAALHYLGRDPRACSRPAGGCSPPFFLLDARAARRSPRPRGLRFLDRRRACRGGRPRRCPRRRSPTTTDWVLEALAGARASSSSRSHPGSWTRARRTAWLPGPGGSRMREHRRPASRRAARHLLPRRSTTSSSTPGPSRRSTRCWPGWATRRRARSC